MLFFSRSHFSYFQLATAMSVAFPFLQEIVESSLTDPVNKLLLLNQDFTHGAHYVGQVD